MSGSPKVPASVRACPFCGLATDVNHESQEGCIAALHTEIARMRRILSLSKPAGAPPSVQEDVPAVPGRISLD
jgi:hypothetical protein